MFVRNLRQRLLAGPVRGSIIMGVDPGYKHGCKLAILSPTSKSPQTKANIIFFCALFIYLTKETNTFSLKLQKAYFRVLSMPPNSSFDLSCAISFHDISISLIFLIFRSDSAYRYFLPSFFKSTKRSRKVALPYEQIQVLLLGGYYVRVHTCFFLFFFKVNCLLLIVSIIAVLRLSSEMGQRVGRLSPCSPTSSPKAIFNHWMCLTGRFDVIGQC